MTTTVVQADEFSQVISGDIFLNRNTTTYDVDGNVVSEGLASTTRLTRDGIGILNNNLDPVQLTGIAFNSDGFAYQDLTSLRATSWDNIATKIAAIQAISQASNATTLNVNNSVQVQYGETITNPTQKILIPSDADGNKLTLDGVAPPANQLLGTDSSGRLTYSPNAPAYQAVTVTSLTATTQAVPILIGSTTYYLPVWDAVVDPNSVTPLPQTAVTVTSLTSTDQAILISVGSVQYVLPLFSATV